jgi:peptidyl-tRNA hydrolase, PTH1 family
VRVVVGLGNPGTRYRRSRHNAGFMVVDGIADGSLVSGMSPGNLPTRWKIVGTHGDNRLLRMVSGPYVGLDSSCGAERFHMVKPVTYMNGSGKAVARILKKGVARDLDDILVVTDDVDLKVGRLRYRTEGSAGGHNGLKSIIADLGGNSFPRLKIGVGPRPDGADLVDYVLRDFPPDEFAELEPVLRDAAEAVRSWITDGSEGIQRYLSDI